MIATIEHQGQVLKVDLSKPLDLSIPIGADGPRAWYVDAVSIQPVINQFFIGSVKLGGSVNFRDIRFNPHGHGTHTESVGHISPEVTDVNTVLQRFFFLARVISVEPSEVSAEDLWKMKGDRIITRQQLESLLGDESPEALVIRTLPNDVVKRSTNYSNTNFCYFADDALAFLAARNVMHLLVDLPSVDRESDGGLLKGHRAFWNYPDAVRSECTITEFVFVADEVPDGKYLLNLQVAPFSNDAAPSRPTLFALL